MIESYPSIYAVGHRFITNLFNGPVVIEEKVDGSQFSFGFFNGALSFRSKGQEIHPGGAEKMFHLGIAQVQAMHEQHGLTPGWTYRAEYLSKPKHNCLNYGSVPRRNLVLFDVMTGHGEHYLDPVTKMTEAIRLGLDCTPCFFAGTVQEPVSLSHYFERESFLGGVKIEGIVVKNYDQFGPDKKILIGKFVSPVFKETHRTSWKVSNPTRTDVEQHLIAELTSEARWRKAVQHLREAGKLTGTPVDIGPLLAEVKADVEREEAARIQELLFKHFWPKIARGITAGFPDWYKKEIGILQ